MAKSVTIYGMKISPRVRLVLMTCEVLGIQYEIKNVNIEDGEHKSKEYLKVSLMSFNGMLLTIIIFQLSNLKI